MKSPTDVTIAQLFRERVVADSNRIALFDKREGVYKPRTWEEVFADVARLAQFLRGMGVGRGDRVVQVSENRCEWLVADLATLLAGAIHVPLHATLAGPQAAFQIRDSGARLVLLSGVEQASKLGACADQLPSDTQFFAYDDPASSATIPVRLLAESLPSLDAVDIESWLQPDPAITADSLATILYTSGTTGEPKGVMLSHGNLSANSLSALQIFGQCKDDRRLTFLPLSHIFARTCGMYTWIAGGCSLALAESNDTVLENCAEFSPTLINGVPYFFDKAHRFLVGQGRDKEKDALKNLFGGSIRMCCTGGAAIPDHVFDFYMERGVPLLQGYGLTESSPVISACSLDANRRSTAGRPIPGVEVKIADDGEILTRGPHVMVGYYKNPEATCESIRDGWLYTGDYGSVDDDGYVKITGRKKEILVTSGGKNVAPVLLESMLMEDPLVAQVMVIGDHRNYLTALIVPDPDVLNEILSALDDRNEPHDGPGDPRLTRVVQERIDRGLSTVSHHEQVRKFILLPRGFSIELGELTPKLSLRRDVIMDHFRDEIESMYGDHAPSSPDISS